MGVALSTGLRALPEMLWAGQAQPRVPVTPEQLGTLSVSRGPVPSASVSPEPPSQGVAGPPSCTILCEGCLVAPVFGHHWFYSQDLDQCLPHGRCSMLLLDDRMKGNTPIWTAPRFLGRNQTSLDGSEEKVFQGPGSTLAGAAAHRHLLFLQSALG